MKTFRFYDIEWDTEDAGDPTPPLPLPTEYTFTTSDPDFNAEMNGVEVLSDKFGYCVHGFNIQEISACQTPL